ncbi:hypothetical protein EVAR_21578_1 [Eumeta japonica]|uniref:Uncharacterized protein n=1 Tax=Eumeta variegata TaxID=151549 RepID=A0A4C1UY23_EUMVA|nr:hypothetical protein EVAR_21578_1 [Eumeta japonica]
MKEGRATYVLRVTEHTPSQNSSYSSQTRNAGGTKKKKERINQLKKIHAYGAAATARRRIESIRHTLMDAGVYQYPLIFSLTSRAPAANNGRDGWSANKNVSPSPFIRFTYGGAPVERGGRTTGRARFGSDARGAFAN